MSENIQKYGVSLEFQNALNALKKFQTASKKFNQIQESALKRQIMLQKQLNKLRTSVPTTSSVPKPSTPIPNKPKPSDDFVGPRIDKNTQQYLKKQAREQRKSADQAERQARALEKAKGFVNTSTFMQKKATTEAEKQAQLAIKNSLANAKNAEEVRRAFRFHKNTSAELRKQHFLMRRMQQSSEQFAGNMVSAFAVAAGATMITQTGQNFEAVNNTMLAVSENTKQAGENFQFVQQEAFRLGLGLTESAKGFAKMVAARGDMSLHDTKEAFKGVAEMSTLLGLSADESNRAINALQQMMSKGVVSAEELKLQMGKILYCY